MNIKDDSLIKNNQIYDSINEEAELDLIEVFKGLLRNKLIILPFISIFSILGLVESIKQTKWIK